MKIERVGIVGNGFVGNAVYQTIKEHLPTFVYDKQEEKSLNSFEEVLNCNIIFICLPTPMENIDGGRCNLNIINNFFSSIPKTDSIFIIKSTVPIGTTKTIKNLRRDLRIIHNPEFLTAVNAVNDFKNSERNIFGGEENDCKIVSSFFKTIMPNTENIIVSSDESETIKYFANSFLAIKVAYFNILYDLTQKLNMNYDKIIKGICSDSRIGFSHSKTPGSDGQRGFGGTCFPKDINALIATLNENNVDSELLQSAWEYNKKTRKYWDWADNKSAVYKGD